MSNKYQWFYFKCWDCAAKKSVQANNQSEAREELEMSGWIFHHLRGKHLAECPACEEKKGGAL